MSGETLSRGVFKVWLKKALPARCLAMLLALGSWGCTQEIDCPNGTDADGDSVCDDSDVCAGHDDHDDFDGDGTPDACDECPFDKTGDVDGDGDGVCDVSDHCSGNDIFGDADKDGICGDIDVCTGDDTSGDTDLDGTCDDVDPCPNDADDDSDGDGSCDSADQCVGDDASGDTDGDGVCDNVDGIEECSHDADADGICDAKDACAGFDDHQDFDGDGAPNGCDECPLDPSGENDADGDGVCDVSDQCSGNDIFGDDDSDGVCGDIDACAGADASGDTDLDGTCDDVDPCPSDAGNDSDGDGSCDSVDLCVGADASGDTDSDGVCDDIDGDDDGDGCRDDDDTAPLVASVDSDGDGIADDCDRCASDNPDDADGDGVCDASDVCAGFDDGADFDADGVPNGCDECPTDPSGAADDDGDGVCDVADACNGFDDRSDYDADGVPNGCDACPLDNPNDSDGDGVCDSDDICPGGSDTADSDSDGTPDFCDLNTPPTAPVVVIKPGAPVAGVDDLWCNVTRDAVDPDGDALTYSFSWYLNDAPYAGPTSTTSAPGDTIPASETSGADIWRCEASAFDGEDSGPTGSDTLSLVACHALKLTSANARISLPNDGFGTGMGDYTLEFWFKRHTDFAGAERVFSTNEDYAAWHVSCFLSPDGSAFCRSYDDSCPCGPGNGHGQCHFIAPTTGWHHLAYVRSSNVAYVFMDGVQVASDPMTVNIQALSPAAIGKMAGYPSAAAAMILGPIRFSTVVRYGTTFTPRARWDVDANTVAQYLVNNPLGATLIDEAGGNNTSTSITDAVAWDTDTPCLP